MEQSDKTTTRDTFVEVGQEEERKDFRIIIIAE